MASDSKKKKLQQMRKQDELGISRKKWKFKMSPKAFVIIKIILIIAIPIFYFVYSPLLLLLMLAYVGLFFLSIMAERSMNKSVIRSSHIHFAKFDSAIALVVILIALCGSVSSGFSQSASSSFGEFNETEVSQMLSDKGFKGAKNFAKKSKYKTTFINFCSLLTGERSVFVSSDGGERKFDFGTMSPPDDFVSDSVNLEMPKFDGNGKDFRAKPMEIMDNIPVAYVSSSMMSSICSVLIFSVSIFGILSLAGVAIKKKKIDIVMSEVIIEGKIELLSESELTRILSFGEDVEIKSDVDSLEIKIKEEHEKTLDEERLFETLEENVIAEEDAEDIEILKDDFVFK